MMTEQRVYKGKYIYPKPVIYGDESPSLLIVAIPWGDPTPSEEGFKIFSDYYFSTLNDVETTTPFEKLEHLSDRLNSLRIATLLANNHIYSHYNAEKFTGAAEFLALSQVEGVISWIKVGGPDIFFHRKEQHLCPLAVSTTLQQELMTTSPSGSDDENKLPLPPLPKHLLGVEKTCSPQLDDFCAQKNDRFLLTTHKNLSAKFQSGFLKGNNLQKLSEIITQQNSESSFWMALFSV